MKEESEIDTLPKSGTPKPTGRRYDTVDDILIRDLAIETQQNEVAAEIIRGFLARFPAPTCREQAVVVELGLKWLEDNT